MRIRKDALLFGVVLLLAVGAWWGWRWYTTPAPPELPLERMEKPVADAIGGALDEVRQLPRSGAAWGKLAMVTAVNGYHDQAIACLVQAERFDPHDPRWPYLHAHSLLAGHPHEALPLLRQALERAGSRERQAAIRFRLALTLIEEEQLDEAQQHLQALRELDGDSARVHFGLGLLAAARDERDVARQHLEAVLSSPFACKQANARLAALAKVDGDEGLARAYQQQAARRPADFPWPDPFLDEMNPYAVGLQNRFLEAESLEARGRLRESVALLRQIASDTPGARSYLALGLGLGKMESYEEAGSVLRMVLQMDPHNLQAQHFLGTVLLLEGEKQPQTPAGQARARALFAEAVAAQDRALAIQADHAMAHLIRGRALGRLGRTDEAIQALREAVLCRPEFSDTHLYLGEALAAAGQVPEGLRHLQDAVRLASPGDPRPRQALEKWQGKAKKSS